MPPSRSSRRRPIVFAGFLVLLLAILATLQWHWIGYVSRLERQSLRERLRAAGTSFAEDFDREVARAFFAFHPEPPRSSAERLEEISRQWERWRAEAPYPQLVRALYRVEPGAASGPGVELYLPDQRRFAPVAWPPELAALLQHLSAGGAAAGGHAPLEPALGRFVAPEIPGLVVPLSYPAPARAPRGGEDLAGDLLVVAFDLGEIESELFPALARLYFPGAGHEKAVVAVVDPAAGDRLLYRSDPALSGAALAAADVRLELFALRPFAGLRALWLGHGLHGPHHHEAEAAEAGMHGDLAPPGHLERGGAWVLAVGHREGSLEAVVARVRYHNLAISLLILALIGATSGVMLVSAERAERLARQQIELVAGVTHELNTPLAAIRSAGENLADGVVADPQKIRRYGELIESEGRRLSSMVGQLLALAGIESGRRALELTPTSVDGLLDGALAECRWLLEQRQVAVERQVEPGLPPVAADAAALRRALANLIENGVKHGGTGGRLEIGTRRAPGGRVEISVADRGPGFAREELPRLFEPFFRGRGTAEGGVPGSGLGLHLVQRIVAAHGGAVTAANREGGGAVFTLRLPAASAPAAAEEGR